MFCFFAGSGTRRSEASGSGLGRSPTAERPEGLDAGAVRRSMGSGEEVLVPGPLILSTGWGGVALINAGVPAVAAVERAARHPFAAQVGGMMGCAVPAGRWGQSEGSTTPTGGGHDLHDPHRPAVRVTAGLMPPPVWCPAVRGPGGRAGRRRRIRVAGGRPRPPRCCVPDGPRPGL